MKQNVSLLTKGMAEIIVAEDFAQELYSEKKLRVKFGIDPTKPDLHLGHTVVLRKLRAFQDAGHHAVLIIGDFTALIGDPSGRPGAREPLTQEGVEKNLKPFFDQVGKVLDMQTVEVRRNSEWLGKMLPAEWLALQAQFTVSQIIDRADFAERLKAGNPIGLHELVYPVMQAYDSVVVRADIELGGIDQKLNLIAGRKLMEKMGMAPQHIILMPLLIGTDGIRKMSKSFGNSIGLNDEPNDMFGKLMAVPDELVPAYFELLTDVEMPNTKNPRDAKLVLAKTIVGMYHDAKTGERAERSFITIFSKKKLPDEIPELKIMNHESSIIHLLLIAGIKTKSEARRLIRQGGIKINNEIKKDPEEIITVVNGIVLHIGKRQFFRLKI